MARVRKSGAMEPSLSEMIGPLAGDLSTAQAPTSLAESLRSISENLSAAAHFSSMTARQLSVAAHQQVQRINLSAHADTEQNVQAVKTAIVLTSGALEAAKMGMSLLAANKDLTRSGEEEAPGGLGHFYGEDSDPKPSSA